MRVDEEVLALLLCGGVAYALKHYRGKWRPSGTAYGTATWASEKILRKAKMLADKGLVLGRTLSGKLIRLPHYCHVLLVGPTGSGKGVSIIIPNLIKYYTGSCVCLDFNGALFEATAETRAAKGQRILRLAPFNDGSETFNPLDSIAVDDPLLIDKARGVAEALVVRRHSEPDPHWPDKSVQTITALIVLVLLTFKNEERNLNSVQEIASDPEMLYAAAEQLREIGGIPARLGSQLKTLFESTDPVTIGREGASILSSVAKYLSFLDSEIVGKAVATSTFKVEDLLEPGTTLYLQVPGEHLEAQKGYLRCVLSMLIREIGMANGKTDNEVLFLLDEASALGSLGAWRKRSYAAVRQVCVLLLHIKAIPRCGRRSMMSRRSFTTIALFRFTWVPRATRLRIESARAWASGQKLSQVMAETIHGPIAMVEGMESRGAQLSYGKSQNFSEKGRHLLKPEEILTLDERYLIAFVHGMAPIFAQRVLWYSDPEFNPAVKRFKSFWAWWALLAVVLGVTVWILSVV